MLKTLLFVMVFINVIIFSSIILAKDEISVYKISVYSKFGQSMVGLVPMTGSPWGHIYLKKDDTNAKKLAEEIKKVVKEIYIKTQVYEAYGKIVSVKVEEMNVPADAEIDFSKITESGPTDTDKDKQATKVSTVLDINKTEEIEQYMPSPSEVPDISQEKLPFKEDEHEDSPNADMNRETKEFAKKEYEEAIKRRQEMISPEKIAAMQTHQHNLITDQLRTNRFCDECKKTGNMEIRCKSCDYDLCTSCKTIFGTLDKLIVEGSRDKTFKESLLKIYQKLPSSEAKVAVLGRYPIYADYPELLKNVLNEDYKAGAKMLISLLTKPQWEKNTQASLKVLEELIRTNSFPIDLVSEKLPGLIKQLIDKDDKELTNAIIRNVLSQPLWVKYPQLLQQIINKNDLTLTQNLIKDVLSEPQWANQTEFLQQLVDKNDEHIDSSIVKYVFGGKNFKHFFEEVNSTNNYKVLQKLLDRGKLDHEIASFVLTKEQWKDHPEFVEQLLNKGTIDGVMVYNVLGKTHWINNSKSSEWVDRILKKGKKYDQAIAFRVLNKKKCKENNPKWVENHIKEFLDKRSADQGIAQAILTKEYWADHSDWMEEIINRGSADWHIADALGKEHWKNHPKWAEWVGQIIKRGTEDAKMFYSVLENEKNHPKWVEWMDQIIKRGKADTNVVETVLNSKASKNHPEWLDQFIERGNVNGEIIRKASQDDFWKDHPEFVEKLIKKGVEDIDYLFTSESNPYWKNYYERLLGKKGINAADIGKFLAQNDNEKRLAEIRKAINSKDPIVIAKLLGNKDNHILFGGCINSEELVPLKELKEDFSNLQDIAEKIVEKLKNRK
ncbi:MAG: hypothetical protein HQK51_15790 [Oligoflexia bacterium]|nr:hypothetical protein [Oligoflexia bacterium]